jgi:hypothetical protein
LFEHEQPRAIGLVLEFREVDRDERALPGIRGVQRDRAQQSAGVEKPLLDSPVPQDFAGTDVNARRFGTLARGIATLEQHGVDAVPGKPEREREADRTGADDSYRGGQNPLSFRSAVHARGTCSGRTLAPSGYDRLADLDTHAAYRVPIRGWWPRRYRLRLQLVSAPAESVCGAVVIIAAAGHWRSSLIPITRTPK